MTEKELVIKAIKRDDEAFLTLLHLHKETLYRTALAFLKNEEEALEALQEVTYRAYRNIEKLKHPEYFKTWLIRIMINNCQDIIKKNKREIYKEDIQNMYGASENFTYIELEEALKSLTKNERELLHLKYYKDVKIKDIATMWDIPEGTIKTKLHKALKALRTYFRVKGET